jgi:hypothetical protein
MADSHGHVNNWLLITRQHHHILPPTPDMATSGVTMDVDHEMVHQVVSTPPRDYNENSLNFALFVNGCFVVGGLSLIVSCSQRDDAVSMCVTFLFRFLTQLLCAFLTKFYARIRSISHQ